MLGGVGGGKSRSPSLILLLPLPSPSLCLCLLIGCLFAQLTALCQTHREREGGWWRLQRWGELPFSLSLSTIYSSFLYPLSILRLLSLFLFCVTLLSDRKGERRGGWGGGWREEEEGDWRMEVVFFFLHCLFSSSRFFLLCIKSFCFLWWREWERGGERERERDEEGGGGGVLGVDGERREEGEKMADWWWWMKTDGWNQKIKKMRAEGGFCQLNIRLITVLIRDHNMINDWWCRDCETGRREDVCTFSTAVLL